MDDLRNRNRTRRTEQFIAAVASRGYCFCQHFDKEDSHAVAAQIKLLEVICLGFIGVFLLAALLPAQSGRAIWQCAFAVPKT